MIEPPTRPLRRRAQARLFRIVNVPMRFLLSLPFSIPLSGRLMLLSLTGRKTGKKYRQPVSYIEQDRTTLLTPGGGLWKRNLVDGQPVRIHLRGQDVLARPNIVDDVDEIDELLAVMMAANPSVSAFIGIPKGPDGHLDKTHLRTGVQHGFRIVRWRLEEPAGIATS
ncbi:MAG: hypothetical protein KGJ86_11605 [Chloroflexota bacterium]|nr:hypothetical protein [Chloroflexota bacterium]